MALSDLELLQLVEKAQDAKRGEKGAQGVGIRSIEQSGDYSFTINLTDGTAKEIALPRPKDGEPGVVGPPGRPGEPGPAGDRGPAGAPGRNGADGADGAEGVSIDTAVVNGNGHLLLGFTDGSVVDVGEVVGPAGLTGERGPVGLRGESGRDGKTILSGESAPSDEEGNDGDFYVDLSSPFFDFYGPKAGGKWGRARIALKQKPANNAGMSAGHGGAGGASADGGGRAYTTATLPLAGTGRSAEPWVDTDSRVDAPGGEIIQPGVGLKWQSNANAWFVESLDLLDTALAKEIKDRIKGDEELQELIDDAVQGAIRSPIYADILPTSHPDYEGEDAKLVDGDRWFDTSNDNLEYRYRDGEWKPTSRPPIYAADEPDTHPGIQGPAAELEQGDIWYDTNNSLQEYIWDGTHWISKVDETVGPAIQRVEDNLDLIQETVGAGRYIRKAKPQTPTGPEVGEAAFLQDGGAEATTFAEVENIQLNKTGIGPYADFSSAKKGDYLLLQSAVDGDFGLYVIRNATEFDTFWDFGLEVSSNKVTGSVPELDEAIVVRTTRPTFTVAQDTPPDFSATGQLWFDTAEHQLKVWDDEEQEFVETGGGASVHVGELPPDEKEEGDLWYDSTRLELFVFYVDGDGKGGWVPCSPLGARVEAGEIVQQQLLERVADGEAAQVSLQAKVSGLESASGDYLKLTGGTLTGTLKMKRTDSVSYWNYIQSETPTAWHTENKNHGLILNIGTTNSFKQQFKIVGRSSKDLFEIHDDGAAVARLNGSLNVTGELKVGGKVISDDTYLKKTGGTGQKMQGNLYLGGFGIKGVAEPEVSTDAATKQYVDSKVAEGGGGTGAIANSGTDSNPTLERGELYLCTSNSTLYIGI